MKYSIETFAMLVMKKEKKKSRKKYIWQVRKASKYWVGGESYKYQNIFKADTINQAERKDKLRKKYLGRTRNHLEKKRSSRNSHEGIKT